MMYVSQLEKGIVKNKTLLGLRMKRIMAEYICEI